MKKSKQILTFAVIVLSLVGIVLWQVLWRRQINYYIVCAVFLVLSMLPFFISFELKKITAREVTLTATLIAIAVVSRAVFYLVPQVKPIAAVVIVSAVCLGPQRGYLIGAFSAFISNFIFGQGYWTPFQMAALGAVGLIAGLIFKVVKVNKITLAAVGFVLAFAVYGAIVDLSTIFMAYGSNVTLEVAAAIYLSGVPFSLVFGISTAVFLLIFGKQFIKKVERLDTKYGLIQK